METIVRKLRLYVLSMTVALIMPAFAQQYQQQQYQQQQQNTGQMQAPAGQGGFCGNRPLCYESADFAATVTQFRTSVDGNGTKILDAILHFQNKTNQALSLGYVQGSGSGLDDRGNRYGLYAQWNGVQGMGIINGNNMDPRFVLGPGGTGDVRFELQWHPPANAVAGVNYEMDLDIREMNRVEGNQWTLGSETMMHYQGLANGISAPADSSFSPSSGGMSPGTGSSYMSGQTPATGGATNGGYAMPSSVNNMMNGVNSSGYMPSGAASVINGVNSSNPSGVSTPVSGVAPNNVYVPPSGGYVAPSNVTTGAATGNMTTAPVTPAQGVVKAAVPVRAQPGVVKAVVIQPVPTAKTAPVPAAKTTAPLQPAAAVKKPVPPPPPPAKKPTQK
ncbi:MAG TPA: hypothetical protein VMB18_02520 [Terriglobales bacterium]|nr:hypothetical protein [Terriglobales bacterium]